MIEDRRPQCVYTAGQCKLTDSIKYLLILGEYFTILISNIFTGSILER